MKKNKIKYHQPEKFQPTVDEELKIMEQLSFLFSENKVLVSHQNPGLEVRGKIKNN